MANARRIGRWALFILGGCAAFLALLWLGVTIYLSTPGGRRLVAHEIELRIGMPVEVQAVRLGFRSSSISFRIFDPHLSHKTGEVLGVESASADIGVFDIISGHIDPKDVTVRGVTLNVRLDAKGDILTTLPKSSESSGFTIPNLTLTQGTVSVEQQGHPKFQIGDISMHVQPQTSDIIDLTGTADDPKWGRWTLGGDVNQTDGTWRLKVASNDAPLATDQLASVPFLPPSIWTHLHAAGRSEVELLLSEGADHKMHFEGDLRPAAATFTITDANTEFTKVTGLIRLTDEKLDLQGMHANLAGGQASLDGSVDFASKDTIAKLKVAATGLNLQELPAEWALPKEIQGKLQGSADLTLVLHKDGRIEPHGGGSGSIADAKIRGIPASISLRLIGNGQQYRFENHDANTNSKSETSGRRFDLSPVIRRATLPISQTAAQPKKDKTPPELEANVRLRDVEITEVLQKLDVQLGYRITGKVSARLTISVPVSKATTSAAYNFNGELTSAMVHFEGLTIRDLSAKAVYKDGKLTLQELSGKIDQPNGSSPPGTFLGTAVAEQEPPGDVSIAFSFEHIPVGEMLKAIPGWQAAARGEAAGKAEFKTKYKSLRDPTAWTAAADLSAPELTVAGRMVRGLHIGLEVRQGIASLKNTAVTVEDIPLVAEATLELKGKYPFTANVHTAEADATNLRKLLPELKLPAVEGVLSANARASGTGSPFDITAAGRISAEKLTLDKTPANEIDVKWELTPKKLVVPEMKAAVFGGSISGSAEVPFSSDQSGKFELAFKSLDAEAATAFVHDFPLQIGGHVSGKVVGTIAPAKPGMSRVGNLEVDLTAPRLTVQGIPAERLSGKATIRAGVLDYQLEGKAFGGSFEVDGSYPGTKPKGAAQPPQAKRGTVRIKGMLLSRIAPELGIKSLAQLRGRLDAQLGFEPDLSAGSGRITLTGLGWGATSMSRELSGVILLDNGTLTSEFNGRVAGGELRARAFLRLKEKGRNTFTIGLAGADAKRLLAMVPELSQKIDGPISLVMQGRLGQDFRGSGTLSMYNGSVSGVPVADLRIPFDWAIGSTGFSRFAVRNATANTGTGKLEANLHLDSGILTQVDGTVRFINVPIRTISPEAGQFSLIGNGRITGRFDLNGDNVHTVDDLTGRLVATLTQTSVREIPILEQIVPFINPAGLVQPFQTGDIRGSLSRGVFRLERLALVNQTGQIFADGNVSLAGRVDLAVVAHTGLLGPANRGLQLLGVGLPVIGPLPLTLIGDVTAFLSNRTIRLTVTGNISNPTVRLNTAALLTEEAVRFFLARYVVPTGAAGALGLGLEGSAFGKK